MGTFLLWSTSGTQPDFNAHRYSSLVEHRFVCVCVCLYYTFIQSDNFLTSSSVSRVTEVMERSAAKLCYGNPDDKYAVLCTACRGRFMDSSGRLSVLLNTCTIHLFKLISYMYRNPGCGITGVWYSWLQHYSTLQLWTDYWREGRHSLWEMRALPEISEQHAESTSERVHKRQGDTK